MGNNWIKTSDRLPDDEIVVDILIRLSNGKYGVGYFLVDKGELVGMRFNGVVANMNTWNLTPTHWSYIEPPREN